MEYDRIIVEYEKLSWFIEGQISKYPDWDRYGSVVLIIRMLSDDWDSLYQNY